ncbi:MAG: aminopeptidase P family protein [Deltaproteobacteria bacterium HGW-Deltaproteobacteria-14]|jgi:Xaa-Pro aminopeptidase|nr:MAG: aminopeptidase P family protein [Deltaproteobacteria bacterium HGW-Deltaproteobacteria-14]
MSAIDRVTALRAAMRAAGVDIYLVPSSDAHQSEYVPGAWQRRPWISGFTGSMGDCVVGLEGAWQWADSRYWLQAEAELDPEVWTLMKQGYAGVPGLVAWLGKLPAGAVVGYDPRLVGLGQANEIAAAVSAAGGRVVTLDDNLVDQVWTDQPALPLAPVAVWSDAHAGRSVADKLGDIRAALRDANASTLVLSTLDAIAWTFNIRGRDVDFNPVVVAYALVGLDDATLFLEPRKVDTALTTHLATAGVHVAPYDTFGAALGRVSQAGGRVWVDPEYASRWVVDHLEAGGATVLSKMSPVMLLKAVKNTTERDGMRACHVRDAVAVVRFLHWLEGAWRDGLDEIGASDRLEAFRAEGERFVGLSFDTISGFGANGAIVHYRATPATAKVISDETLYLLDSGAQYLDGTTDITRTVHLGTPTATQREHYTRVLRGHLQLGRARFPRGTTGTALDTLARTPLWEAGLNYGHGTGHGVGCYLSVHQGPHRISPRPNDVGLEPGMITSNEPGLYIAGEYGIRIENLCVVVPAGGDEAEPFYAFEDLTVVPYHRDLIEPALLNDVERAQVDAYHARVRSILMDRVPAEVRPWLERETAPLD